MSAPDRRRRSVHRGASALGALAVVAVGALVATGDFGDSGAASASAPGVPDLRPPQISVLHRAPGLGPGLIVLGAKNRSPGSGEQAGPLIVDDTGRPVWFRPLPPGQVASDVRVQRYQGRPVLTWWQGTTLGGAGHGHGEGVIADSSYHVIAHVHAGHGYFADQHTFLVTPQNTALIEAYHETRRDLSSAGGSRNGRVYDGIVQEIDLTRAACCSSGTASTTCRSPTATSPRPRPEHALRLLPHQLGRSRPRRQPDRLESPHLDRLQDRPPQRADHLAAGRQAQRLPAPARRARFAWQHNPMPVGNDMLRIFDNESNGKPVNPASRVITLRLDRQRSTATLVKSIEHPARLSAPSQGNSEQLPDGDLFVGWGRLGRFSEFSPDGRLVLDAVFPPGYDTYRAYRFPWTGHPSPPPAAAARRDGPDTRVDAFWNGATDVARWRILAGRDPGALRPVDSVAWNGLDTTASVPTHASWVAVAAEDATGQTVATSAPVRVSG